MEGRFKLGRAALWALTWAVGAAIGVAVGGWLTVVGGAGTPGTESLDLAEDVVLLPGAAGIFVFFLHLTGQGLIAVVRGRRTSGQGHEDD